TSPPFSAGRRDSTHLSRYRAIPYGGRTRRGGEPHMHIGIAGIGKMGGAIAHRLLDLGNALTVWNRSPQKLQPLNQAGAVVAPPPAELAAKADTIITILTDAAAIHAVYGGAPRLISGDVPAKLFIDMR